MDANKQILVTGPTGFAGSHLVDSLLADGHIVRGLVHAASSHQPVPGHSRFRAVKGDLLDGRRLNKLVAESDPQVIFHLAGQASPGLSWKSPGTTIAVNTIGTVNLLQAAKQIGSVRIVIVTSAEVYGSPAETDLPLTELTPPQPSHPYAVSKLAASQLGRLFWQKHGLRVIEARPFNHIGPRQTLGFVVADFASQLARVKLGKVPPIIEVGNLQPERDFTDVRDVVRAYRLLAESGKPGEMYLICSGRAVAVRVVLQDLIEIADVDVEVQADPERIRAIDAQRVVGSYVKIRDHTGWNPKIGLRQSLSDTLTYWLKMSASDGRD